MERVTDAGDSFRSDYAVSPVPHTDRRSFYKLMAIWVASTESISSFLVGGVVASGTKATDGILAILLGNLVLVVIGSLIGMVGYRTGLTTYSINRIIFGKKGSIIVSLLIGILAMGFIGVLMSGFGAAIHVLIPAIPAMLANFIFAVLVTVITIYGFKGLSALSVWAAPLLWIFLLVGLFAAFKNPGSFSAIFNMVPSKPMGFWAAAGAAIATWVTGSMLSSDISRYAKKGSHIWGATFCGYVFGAGLFQCAAMLMAKGAGSPNVVTVMGHLGLLVPGALLLLLALWNVTNRDVYASSLAFTNAGDLLGLKIGKPIWTVIAVLIALIFAEFNLVAHFQAWLNFIGMFAPPLGGIIIGHFWIVNRNSEYVEPTGFVPLAFISWIVASLIAKYLVITVPAPIVGLVSALIIYSLLFILFRAVRK